MMENQNKKMKEKINLFIKKLREMPDFDRMKFVFLFGSYSAGKENKLSDIDFAVYYEGNSRERFKFRLKLLMDNCINIVTRFK